MKSTTAAPRSPFFRKPRRRRTSPMARARIGCPFENRRAPGNYSLGVIRVALFYRRAGPECRRPATNEGAAHGGHDNAMPLVIVHLLTQSSSWRRCFAIAAAAPCLRMLSISANSAGASRRLTRRPCGSGSRTNSARPSVKAMTIGIAQWMQRILVSFSRQE